MKVVPPLPPPPSPPSCEILPPSVGVTPRPQRAAVPYTDIPVQETNQQTDAQGEAASHPPIEPDGLASPPPEEDIQSNEKDAGLPVQETNPAPQADEGSQLSEATVPDELDGAVGQTSETENS